MLRRRWHLGLHSLADLVEDDPVKGNHPVVEGSHPVAEGSHRAGPIDNDC